MNFAATSPRRTRGSFAFLTAGLCIFTPENDPKNPSAASPPTGRRPSLLFFRLFCHPNPRLHLQNLPLLIGAKSGYPIIGTLVRRCAGHGAKANRSVGGYERLLRQCGAGLQSFLAKPSGHRVRRPFPERSEEHTSELQSRENLVCRLLLEKKKS